MSAPQLEERVARLETEVAHLKSLLPTTVATSNPWWEKITGTFANNPAFEEAMQLGKQYRQSLRQDSEKPPTD
ncbi:MAG: hypothetical protein Fur006_06270 [Coleofasciculaceae cyanobacterium]